MKLSKKKIKYTVLVILWIVSIVCLYQTEWYQVGARLTAVIVFLMFSVVLFAGIMVHDLPKKAFEWLNSND